MATGKVARRADASEISALLDSPEVSRLIGKLDALRWTGRKGYGARALVGACLVKALYGLPTWTRVASLIADHPGLQDALGGCPSLWACYRFTTKLVQHSAVLANALDDVLSALQNELPGMGVDVAIDASDMPAFASGHERIWKDGPKRERYSDPDASWGHRSAVSTRSAGSFYGYKLHAAVCARTGIPLAWTVMTARRNESLYVSKLLDSVIVRGFAPQTCAMDKGYDNNRVMDQARERKCVPIVPLRKGRAVPLLPISYGSTEWKRLYRGRQAVERAFAELKQHYGFAPLRVRGLERVNLHADLVMISRLSQALNRARALAIAA
jgi:hypothetical protein